MSVADEHIKSTVLWPYGPWLWPAGDLEFFQKWWMVALSADRTELCDTNPLFLSSHLVSHCRIGNFKWRPRNSLWSNPGASLLLFSVTLLSDEPMCILFQRLLATVCRRWMREVLRWEGMWRSRCEVSSCDVQQCSCWASGCKGSCSWMHSMCRGAMLCVGSCAGVKHHNLQAHSRLICLWTLMFSSAGLCLQPQPTTLSPSTAEACSEHTQTSGCSGHWNLLSLRFNSSYCVTVTLHRLKKKKFWSCFN